MLCLSRNKTAWILPYLQAISDGLSRVGGGLLFLVLKNAETSLITLPQIIPITWIGKANAGINRDVKTLAGKGEVDVYRGRNHRADSILFKNKSCSVEQAGQHFI